MENKKIQYSGHIISEEDKNAVKEVLDDGWLGRGDKCNLFEEKISNIIEKKYGVFVNSGSSANLLAMTAAKKLWEMDDGDEVIVSGVNFPTSVNCIIQNNLVPVFVDCKLDTFNIDVELIRKAVSSKTKAIMVVHTLGNPCDMDEIVSICDEFGLCLIEDCCDALMSMYKSHPVGYFGDFATISFYPAHLISTGGGGMICCNSEKQRNLLRSLSEWGRACNCYGQGGTTKDGMCGKRFSKWLPIDDVYDHKYVYENIGYCLSGNEIGAAIGLEQLKKISYICAAREENFVQLYNYFSYREEFLLIQRNRDVYPLWFAFPLTIKKDAGFKRSEIVSFLESNGIQTRPIFGGNLLLHPLYKNSEYRVVGELANSNYITENSFFIGVWEEISTEDIQYIIDKFEEFLNGQKRS